MQSVRRLKELRISSGLPRYNGAASNGHPPEVQIEAAPPALLGLTCLPYLWPERTWAAPLNPAYGTDPLAATLRQMIPLACCHPGREAPAGRYTESWAEVP